MIRKLLLQYMRASSNLSFCTFSKFYFLFILMAALLPIHQFLNAAGISGTQSCNVKLVITNDLNCSDSVTSIVTVKKIPDASIGNGSLPDVIFGSFNGRQTFRRYDDKNKTSLHLGLLNMINDY